MLIYITLIEGCVHVPVRREGVVAVLSLLCGDRACTISVSSRRRLSFFPFASRLGSGQCSDRMITDRIKELESAKAKVAKLEAEITAKRSAELARLPAKYGFDSVNSFVAAVKTAAGKRGARKSAVAKSSKRSRAKITDATRAAAKKLVEAGKTGAEIAKTLGISIPSVQNIKKALGLVKKR